MTYTEALDYLRSLTKFGSNLGLERMEAILRRLGNPEKGLKVIHVAGTNGKGSLCAMLSSILYEAGYRVGLYTSPHLSSFTERIRVDGREIPEDDLIGLIEELTPIIEEVSAIPELGHPTEFEVTTVLGFMYFARQSLDFVILEVGLGGRLDATNVVTPVVSAITHIDFDHMERLGNTLPQIAFEKAGIIKPGVMTVVGLQEAPAIDVIKRVALEKGAPLIRVGPAGDDGYHVTYNEIKPHLYWTTFSGASSMGGWEYSDLRVSLIGEHQGINAAVALGVVEALRSQGVELSEGAVRLGLLRTIWPGRLEMVGERPMVLLDGAHNPDGARALRKSLDNFSWGRDGKTILVAGMLADKEVDKVVDILGPVAHGVVTTLPDSLRALPAEELAEKMRRHSPWVEVENSPERAVERGLAMAEPHDIVCICGSFYLVGAVRPELLHRRRVVIFAGAFGSGKTEVAINYSIRCARRGEKVRLIDLDIVNPYFRSRELQGRLAAYGVEVIYSSIQSADADLPALSPKILGALHDAHATTIFDVGGDDLGATVLGGFQSILEEIGYDMYFVLNPFRPLTHNQGDLLQMCHSISQASRLSGSGLIANPNLGDETQVMDIVKGYDIIKKAVDSINLPVRFISINEKLIGDIAKADRELRFEEEIFPLKLFMKLPWLRDEET
jgi:dihydrofolate synthase/folylpolyglutamate synthase